MCNLSSPSSRSVEWEIKDVIGGGGTRELHIALTKTGKTAGSGPLWPQLLKGHPEIDVCTDHSTRSLSGSLHTRWPDITFEVSTLRLTCRALRWAP